MSDGNYLRSMAARRDTQGRHEDAHFLRLMAAYFDLLARSEGRDANV